LSAQELHQQLAHGIGLLLLHPMPGAIDEMSAAPLRADADCLHRLEDAGSLKRTPVALAGDEAGRHVDGATRERAQLGESLGIGAAPHPVALQSAGETSPGIFRGVNAN